MDMPSKAFGGMHCLHVSAIRTSDYAGQPNFGFGLCLRYKKLMQREWERL